MVCRFIYENVYLEIVLFNLLTSVISGYCLY